MISSCNRMLLQIAMLSLWYQFSRSSIVQLKRSSQEDKAYVVPCSRDESSDISRILEATECAHCKEAEKRNLTQQEIKLLQAYLVKSKILEGLNMKSEPCPKIPKPSPQAVQAIISAIDNDTAVENFDDDSNGFTTLTKTESVAVFPKSEKRFHCGAEKSQFCSRLDFYLPNKIETHKVSSLELWVSNRWKPNEQFIQTVFLSSAQGPCTLEAQTLNDDLRKIDSKGFDEWWKVQLSLQNCSSEIQGIARITAELKGVLIDTGDDARPFLLVRILQEEKRFSARSRRSALCVEGSKTCCRQPFYLNFTELEMDSWILYPLGYNAYSCTGECLSDISSSRDHYTSLLMDYIREHPSMAKSLGLSVCCVPSVMSPLSIVYRDDEGNIYPKRSIPNMIVDGCVCA